MNKGQNASLALGAMYFLFFGILGLFLPYFNLFCYTLDFSPRQIGLLSAAQALMKFASPLIWAHWAYRTLSRKKLSALTSAASGLLFLAALYTSSFIIMLAVITLYAFFRTAIVPIVDAAAWEAVDNGGTDYGKIRVWGSAGFLVTSVLGGYLMDRWSIPTVLSAIVFLSLILFALSFRMPEAPENEKREESSFSVLALLREPRLFFFMLVCMLMQVSHGAYYGFFTIHMEEMGFSRTTTGAAWALSIVAEIVLMIQYRRWTGRTRPQVLMIFSCFVAAWRWWIMAYSQSIVFFFLAQASHAVTFTVFHIASQSYMTRQVPLAQRAGALAVLNAVSYGLGGTIGFSLSGWLYEGTRGEYAFLTASVSALLGGTIAFGHYFARIRALKSPRPVLAPGNIQR